MLDATLPVKRGFATVIGVPPPKPPVNPPMVPEITIGLTIKQSGSVPVNAACSFSAY